MGPKADLLKTYVIIANNVLSVKYFSITVTKKDTQTLEIHLQAQWRHTDEHTYT